MREAYSPSKKKWFQCIIAMSNDNGFLMESRTLWQQHKMKLAPSTNCPVVHLISLWHRQPCARKKKKSVCTYTANPPIYLAMDKLFFCGQILNVSWGPDSLTRVISTEANCSFLVGLKEQDTTNILSLWKPYLHKAEMNSDKLSQLEEHHKGKWEVNVSALLLKSESQNLSASNAYIAFKSIMCLTLHCPAINRKNIPEWIEQQFYCTIIHIYTWVGRAWHRIEE